MKSNYKRLGPYIKEVNVRNIDGIEDNLLGVSTNKVFIQSIANTIGTDFKKYKVVKKLQFTYVPDTSRRGDKIGIALLDDYNKALVSSAYTVFEIIDHEELLPEYLMMWFRRPEFDRYARYMSHGSVREIFGWEEMCDVELPVPDIEKQKEIVAEYNAVVNRIKLNEELNKKLEVTAQAIYKQWFVDFEFPNEDGKPYKSSGGRMVWNDELGKEIPEGWEIRNLKSISSIKGGKRLPKNETLISTKTVHPYIKVADMGNSKFIILNKFFEYLPLNVQQQISRYTVSTGDLILSIVGTIGIAKVIHKSLDGANLTENCVKITKITKVTTDYLYHFLKSDVGKIEIEMKIVGGVQGKLPIYNIGTLKVCIPDKTTMSQYSKAINKVNVNICKLDEEIVLLVNTRDLLLSKMAKG